MDIVDVTVKVGETLPVSDRQQLEERLRGVPGVIAPRFNDDHDLVVAYDPATTGSAAILAAVRERSADASLVGM